MWRLIILGITVGIQWVVWFTQLFLAVRGQCADIFSINILNIFTQGLMTKYFPPNRAQHISTVCLCSSGAWRLGHDRLSYTVWWLNFSTANTGACAPVCTPHSVYPHHSLKQTNANTLPPPMPPNSLMAWRCWWLAACLVKCQEFTLVQINLIWILS